jgi:hypothetical protein
MNVSAPFVIRPIATTLLMIGLILLGVVAYVIKTIEKDHHFLAPCDTIPSGFATGADRYQTAVYIS